MADRGRSRTAHGHASAHNGTRGSGTKERAGPEADETQDSEGDRVAAHSRRTQAVLRRSRWPGWIWAVPIAAVGILLWFGVRFFATHGTTITVVFDKAPGVSAQGTRVTYRGVDIGAVSSVSLAPDGRQVIVKLALDRSVEKYLRSGTRFWLQGVSLQDPSTLGDLISGPAIEMDPGSGAPQRTFVALSQPPAYTEPVAGTRFTLVAAQRGSAQQGSSVYYLGLEVGKVLDVQMVPPHQFRFDVLVRTPYDRLVHRGSRFWDAGALELSLANGVKLQLLSASALLQGAIAFDTPPQAAQQPAGEAGEVFTLYGSEHSAQLAPAGPYALYRVQFDGGVGELAVGAAVKLRDFTVGEVREVNFELDPHTGTLRTPVTIELDAERLHLAGSSGALPGDWTALLNAALDRLVHAGLRARLEQSPELVGPYYVGLDFVSGATPAMLQTSAGGAPPEIPAVQGGGLGALTAKLGQLPIQEIGANVRQITDHVRTLVAAPQLQDSLQHLDGTLSTLDGMVHGVAPQIQPLIANLRQTAAQLQGVATAAHQALGGPDAQGGLDETVQEVTRAARSVRVLADYLERHPESLLAGKR